MSLDRPLAVTTAKSLSNIANVLDSLTNSSLAANLVINDLSSFSIISFCPAIAILSFAFSKANVSFRNCSAAFALALGSSLTLIKTGSTLKKSSNPAVVNPSCSSNSLTVSVIVSKANFAKPFLLPAAANVLVASANSLRRILKRRKLCNCAFVAVP